MELHNTSFKDICETLGIYENSRKAGIEQVDTALYELLVRTFAPQFYIYHFDDTDLILTSNPIKGLDNQVVSYRLSMLKDNHNISGSQQIQ